MAQFNIPNLKPARFSDFAHFVDSVEDLELIDILNDTTEDGGRGDYASSPGAFVYELDLMVNFIKANDLDIRGLKLEFYDQQPDVVLPRERKTKSRAKRAREAKGKNEALIRTFAPRPILEASFDFPSRRDTPQTTEVPILLDLSQVTSDEQDPVRLSRALATTSNSGLSLSSAVTHSPAAFNGAALGAISQAVSVSANSMLTNTALPRIANIQAEDVRAAISTSTTRSSLVAERASISNRRKAAAKALTNTFSSFASTGNIIGGALNASKQPRSIANLGHLANLNTEFHSFRRTIEIPKANIASERLYVKLSAVVYEGSSTNIPTTTIIVNHERKLQEILTPIFAPRITVAASRPGSVVLNVATVDPVATSVTVQKTVVDILGRVILDEQIDSVALSYEERTKTVLDLNAENILPNSVEYTVTTVSPSGEDGVFSSTSVSSFSLPGQRSHNAGSTALAIIAKNTSEGISIDVERIPERITTVRVLREDMSKVGDFASRVSVVPNDDGETLHTVFGRSSISLLDKTAAIKRPYRYFCALSERLGSEKFSAEDEVIIRRTPQKPLPVEVLLENIVVGKDENGRNTVSIDALSLPIAQSMDLLFDLMRSSGLSEVFIEEFNKQKTEFAQLAAFIVERVNRETGRRVSFGLSPTGTFVDNAESRAKINAPDLDSSNRYTYYFKLCLQSPQTFMNNVVVAYSNKVNPGVFEKAQLSSKFMSSFTAAFGAMPSDAELIKGVGVGEVFRRSQTGKVLTTDITIPHSRAVPRRLTLSKQRKGTVAKLSWESSSLDLSNVLLCNVGIDFAGISQVIGTVRVSGSTKRFAYYDREFLSRVGTKTYWVKFVYKDFSESSKSNTVSDTKAASINKDSIVFKQGTLKGVVTAQDKKWWE